MKSVFKHLKEFHECFTISERFNSHDELQYQQFSNYSKEQGNSVIINTLFT